MSWSKRTVDALAEALETRPGDFSISPYTLADKATGWKFWVGNGFFFYGTYEPVERGFSLWQKWRFARLLKKWKESRLAYPQVRP